MTAITVNIPPSKSVSHRAMLIAALSLGRSNVSNVLESDDVLRTIECLKLCGTTIERTGPGAYAVDGVNGTMSGGAMDPVVLDVGESGTTCRLLTAVVAPGVGVFRIQGQGRMHERPIGELTHALTELGATITFEEKEGYPPFKLEAAGILGKTAPLSLNESSQYLSGLLLAAPLARGSVHIEIIGDKVVSLPYVALTLKMLEDNNIRFHMEHKVGEQWEEVSWKEQFEIRPGFTRFKVIPGMYMARDYSVENDWSNASYFLAAGAVGPGPVTAAGMNPDSLQGDMALLDLLERMQAKVEWNTDKNAVTVAPGELKGIDVDMGMCPDLVPTIAAVAATAQGETRIRNVAHLRIKESDRLSAVAQELSKVGTTVEVMDDGLRIQPNPMPKGETVNLSAHNDHRIAMSGAILQRAGVNTVVDNPDCTAKSFPTFWDEWKKLL